MVEGWSSLVSIINRSILLFPLQSELLSLNLRCRVTHAPPEPFLLYLFPWKLLPPGSSGAIPQGVTNLEPGVCVGGGFTFYSEGKQNNYKILSFLR